MSSSEGWGVKFYPKEQQPSGNFDYQAIDWQKEEQKFRKDL